MAKHRCSFDEIARKALIDIYKIVKELDQKVDYIIEDQRNLYYSRDNSKTDYYGEKNV